VSGRAGFLFAVGAALLAAIPAALRHAPALLVWLALSGSTAVVLGPLLASLRQLRPVRRGLLAIALGIGLAAWPTAFLLSLLKSTTHHRPLGAVTFAFAAGFVLLAASAGALRLLTWLQVRTGSGRERLGHAVLTVCALSGPLVLLLRLGGSPQTRTHLFDASLALGLAASFLIVPWPARVLRWAERTGPLVWVLTVAVGLLAAHADRERAFDASPALLAPFAWLLR
jgi:hypothetical protein